MAFIAGICGGGLTISFVMFSNLQKAGQERLSIIFEIMSTIATFLAVGVSLYLANRKSKPAKLEVSSYIVRKYSDLLPTEIDYEIFVIIANVGQTTASIKEVSVHTDDIHHDKNNVRKIPNYIYLKASDNIINGGMTVKPNSNIIFQKLILKNNTFIDDTGYINVKNPDDVFNIKDAQEGNINDIEVRVSMFGEKEKIEVRVEDRTSEYPSN